MPSLARINPQVKDAVLRLSTSARRDLEYVERAVDDVWPDVVEVRSGHLAVGRAAFAGLDPSVGAHLLRRAAGLASDGLSDLGLRHVDEMLDLLNGPAGRSTDLPGGLVLSVGYQEATLGPAGLDTCPLPLLANEVELEVPGETAVGGWRVIARTGDHAGDAHCRRHVRVYLVPGCQRRAQST